MDKGYQNSRELSLGGFNDLIKGRYGWMVFNKNDLVIGKSIKEYGEWSQLELDFLTQLLNPNDVVIEIGSNIGSHTIPFSKILKKGHVYGFEPQNIIFQNLCANLSLNSTTNCICERIAISDSRNEKLFMMHLDSNKSNNFGNVSLLNSKSDDSVPVQVDILDNKFSYLKHLKLLKLDVEGNEINALKGGENLIKRTKPFLYLENDRLNNSQYLIEYIFSLDYKLFWHIPPLFNKKNFFKNKNNIFQSQYSFNMFGFHKDLQLKTDLFEIKDSNCHPMDKKYSDFFTMNNLGIFVQKS